MEAERETIEEVILLSEKLKQIAKDLRVAVNLSIEIRRRFPESKQDTVLLWEEFLGQLFGYIKQRSKEAKDNLLSGISITRLKLF